MAIIKKKIWPEYFELVRSGKKRFEVRKNRKIGKIGTFLGFKNLLEAKSRVPIVETTFTTGQGIN